MTQPPLTSEPQPASTPTRLLAGCGGAMLALVCVGVYWLIASRGTLAAVTPPDLAAARARWDVNRPPSYDLEIRVTGQENSLYAVQVRGGEIVAATRNGVALPGRIWHVWDVPGLFGVIAIDLEKCAGTPGQPAGNLVLRGEFDAELGFPRRYQRIQLNPATEVSWEIVSFERT